MPEPTPGLALHPTAPDAAGQKVPPLRLDATSGTLVIGRAADADWTIPDMTVSRRHATLQRRGDSWLLADLASRHGTWLNGQQLVEGERLPVHPGDHIRFGRWTCSCQDQRRPVQRMTTVAAPTPASRVKSIEHAELGGVAQQRLDALIDAGRQLERATDRGALARTLVDCTADGTGCRRVMVVRPAGGDSFDVIASTEHAGPPKLSRSLIEAAAQGTLAQLSGGADTVDFGQSVLDLGISSAICAPLLIDGVADSFLYLDTRGAEGILANDVAAFCSAIAQLGAMATERLAAAEMRARREQLEQDLAAARRAQQLMMPPKSGSRPGLTYCFESIPGRFVAGDLFDLIALPDGRTAFFLGDVAGKGVGAGLLMAAAQTHLRTLLTRAVELAEAVTSLNELVLARTEPGTFLTLFACVFDPVASRLDLADAGHGFCCRCEGGGPAQRLVLQGGLPIGIDEESQYVTETIPLAPGNRLVLFSDGLVEQPDPDGVQFGLDEALARLRPESDPATDVSSLIEAVRAHAQGPFADDLTIVSVQASTGT